MTAAPQVPDAVRAKAIKRASKLIKETLAATKFARATIIPVAAKPGKHPDPPLTGLLLVCADAMSHHHE